MNPFRLKIINFVDFVISQIDRLEIDMNHFPGRCARTDRLCAPFGGKVNVNKRNEMKMMSVVDVMFSEMGCCATTRHHHRIS